MAKETKKKAGRAAKPQPLTPQEKRTLGNILAKARAAKAYKRKRAGS